MLKTNVHQAVRDGIAANRIANQFTANKIQFTCDTSERAAPTLDALKETFATHASIIPWLKKESLYPP